MDLQQRIAQFENMAQADPENEMAHFSLAGAYAQAERFADAADAYLRCTQVNPGMSKAFQLAGETLLRLGDQARAAEVLARGYEVAALKGDLMPKRAIADLLKSIGRPVPEVAGADTTAEALIASGAFVCHKTGRPGHQMDRPPFRGPVGQWVHQHISRETFDEWIRQGTKVINELRLDLSRDQDADTYDRYMREYLGIDDALHARLRSSK
ncbi:MAG TPA: hypothetical protein DEB06_11355 [Phycisphaerales bacterium]|nr:hypothetical protein [Phycisphaerales bacterium]